ncbi:MAG: hypothetical protein WCV90_04900 [Candidatus Woesearchaeota archaeon]|jgi:hypothetical protein
MANAYIFDLVGVLVDLDMSKVNEYFAQEGKSELFQLRKSPDEQTRFQAETEFEQTLEKAILSGYVPATAVPGVDEIREAIIEDPTGNLVIYSNGTTKKTINCLLDVAEIPGVMIEDEPALNYRGGLFVLDGKACGNKSLSGSYKNMIEIIEEMQTGVRASCPGVASPGYEELVPRLFVDDQKDNALAARGIGAYSHNGFEMSVWLDRKNTCNNRGLGRSGIVVMQNLSQVAGYIKYKAIMAKRMIDRDPDLCSCL